MGVNRPSGSMRQWKSRRRLMAMSQQAEAIIEEILALRPDLSGDRLKDEAIADSRRHPRVSVLGFLKGYRQLARSGGRMPWEE